MRVACIAVRAPEGAAHIRIDRPEGHSGRGRAVQETARICSEVPDILLLTQQRGRPFSRVFQIEHGVLHRASGSAEMAPFMLPNISRSCKPMLPRGGGTSLVDGCTLEIDAV